MRVFAEQMAATATITSKRAQKRFLKQIDLWTARLHSKGLVTPIKRQELRKQIAEAVLVLRSL